MIRNVANKIYIVSDIKLYIAKMLRMRSFFKYGLLLIAATLTASESEDIKNNVKSTLERALGSNNSDNIENIHFLNKVQKVISKMKNVFVNNRNARRANNDVNLEKFTDFIQDVIKKLNKYNDNDLKNFFAVFSNEVTNYHYRGCKFHELTENFAFRIYLSGLLKDIKVQPGTAIKNKLEAIANKMKKKQYDRNEKELVDVINSLYRQDTKEALQNVLVNIDAYRMKSRKNIDLVKIVRDGLRSVVFDHYTKLNHNARRALKLQINEYWNNLSGRLPAKAKDTVKTSKDDINEFTTTPRVNKRIILKENDRYIEVGLKYGQKIHLRNDENKVTPKSLYLPTVPTTHRLNNTVIKKIKKDLKTEDIVKNNEKFRLKTNRRPSKINLTHVPSRTTKHSEATRYYTKDNMNLKYETDAYEYLTAEARKKKLTFMTLYPEFVPAWTSSKHSDGRRKLSQRKPVNKRKYVWQEADISDVTPKRLIGIRYGAAAKKFQAQLNNPIKFSADKETSSEKLMRLKKKIRLSKSAESRRRSLSTNKKLFRDSIFSLESASSDDLETVDQKISYRRNEETNTTTTNISLTVSNDSFKVQNSEIVKQHIGNQMDDSKTIKTLNEVKKVKNQFSSENNKADGNITISNTKYSDKLSTEVDSTKKYPNDINVINNTHSSDESYSENEERHNSNANIETNDLKSRHYIKDNNTYNDNESFSNNTDNIHKSCTSIYDKGNTFKPRRPNIDNIKLDKENSTNGIHAHLYSEQVKSESKNSESMEINEELEAWEPKAKKGSKNPLDDNENYYARFKQSARKRNEDIFRTSRDFKNEKINNIENTVTTETLTNTTSISNLHPDIPDEIVYLKTTTNKDRTYNYEGTEVTENIDEILATREEGTARYGKSVTKSIAKEKGIKSGEIKHISEEHDNGKHIKDSNERVQYINENDLLADDFPEVAPVLGKIAGRA